MAEQMADSTVVQSAVQMIESMADLRVVLMVD
jgi:hypothetical protein